VLALDQNQATSPAYDVDDHVGFTAGNFGDLGDITFKLIRVVKDDEGKITQTPIDTLTQVVKGNKIGVSESEVVVRK